MVCCCDQIGRISRLAILGFTGLAIFLQIMASVDCEFMKYEVENEESGNFEGTIGLFVENDDFDKCPDAVGHVLKDIDDLDDDPYMRSARSMMTLSTIFGFSAACLICFEFLCCRVCCAATLESLAFTAASFLGGLAYLAFGSEYCTGTPEQALSTAKDIVFGDDDTSDLYNCSFGKGCSMNLTAMLIYLIAGAALCCTPKPTPLLAK